jgi:hypothetical protein
MADTKITDLASLTGANSADTDVVPLVDVSDTSMAASGTTKKITIAELAKAVGDGGRLILDTNATPSAPSEGTTLFTRHAARRLPAFIGPSNVDSSLQPHIGANKAAWFQCTGNATTVVTPGITLTVIGTATAANWANTNMFTNARRLSYISGAAAGSAGGWREAVAKYSMGTAGYGGFHIMARFGCLTLPAGYRIFVGLHSSTSVIGNVDPSSLTNMAGLGKDTGDTTLQFMYNDGSGTAQKINTGITLATSDVVDFRMFSAPGSGKIWFSIQILNGGGSLVNGDTGVSTDVPAAGTGLCIHNWCNNNATASAIDPHWMNYYIETDN